ncbi:hypothetical protein GDO86_010319 [Hymenochirus boettgeri]|uniref:Laminin G domain-containing protein n=1 Tax=Hymenochirus boettgeri TaxID=247094 RepID=A0A8T2JSZ6_9PIPI|nr:hypothetical protein GDO86_010319 [Hymenochirus boettgeri]
MGKLSRSSDSLFLGAGHEQNILRMKFQLSELTSNQSSFDFRTFDSEGVIFYGNVGKDNWFVLGIRESRLEVQMSNNNGQMLLSKWGPNISDGQWRKVTVDSGSNTIEVKVDGELVVRLTHQDNPQPNIQSYSELNILLGDLPSGIGNQLIIPLQPALDGCLRNWAWVKKEAQALGEALNSDENRRCFEQEELGSFFPRSGYAFFKPTEFQTLDMKTWGLSIKVSFRVVEEHGIILKLYDQNLVPALEMALDCQKKVFVITLLGNVTHAVTIPKQVCSGNWHFKNFQISTNMAQLNMTNDTLSWEIDPSDSLALRNVWLDSASHLFIGGVPDYLSAQGPHFSGCLKMNIQGQAVNLDMAYYKHPHVHSHSCPQWSKIESCSDNAS